MITFGLEIKTITKNGNEIIVLNQFKNTGENKEIFLSKNQLKEIINELKRISYNALVSS